MRSLGPVALLFTVLLCSPAQAASSVRCDRQLVAVGESVLALRAACGAPDDITVRTRSRVVRLPNGAERRVLFEEEHWLYAGRDGSLARVVQIRKGRIHSIETLSTLVNLSGAADRTRCRRQLFREERATQVEVRATCGVPDHSERWLEELLLPTLGAGSAVGGLVRYERWTYDFGPNHLQRIFLFANGRLLEATRGPRGVARAPEAAPSSTRR